MVYIFLFSAGEKEMCKFAFLHFCIFDIHTENTKLFILLETVEMRLSSQHHIHINISLLI